MFRTKSFAILSVVKLQYGAMFGDGLLDLSGSEAVGQLLSEIEWLGFIDRTLQVPHASRTSFLHHQPAGALPSRLLLRSLLRPFPLQPPGDEKTMENTRSKFDVGILRELSK